MLNIKKLIQEQCDATANIRERHGLQSAMAYLIREKFINCLQASEVSKEHADELLGFAKRIKEEFQPYEISEFFDDSKNFSNLILDEEGQAEMDEMMADADEDEIKEMEEESNIVRNAEDILRLERAKEWLLTVSPLD
jgi:hypothetical protein